MRLENIGNYLSHGYRIVSRDDPDLTVMKMYFPDDPQIQVHQERVQMCPDSFPPGFYWYSKMKHGPGHPSKKICKKLAQLNDVLGQPPISDDNYQTEVSTKNRIGNENNQLVIGSQTNNQPVDNSGDSPSL